MHNILPIPEVLRVDDVFSSIGYSYFNHIDELQLRSDGNLFVSPEGDLELDVEISGQIETVPIYSDLWRVALVDRVLREEYLLGGCGRSFCDEENTFVFGGVDTNITQT